MEGDLAVSAAPLAARQPTAAGNPLGTLLREQLQLAQNGSEKKKKRKEEKIPTIAYHRFIALLFSYDYFLYISELMIDADKKKCIVCFF